MEDGVSGVGTVDCLGPLASNGIGFNWVPNWVQELMRVDQSSELPDHEKRRLGLARQGGESWARD